MVNFIFNHNRETICTNCSKHTVTGRHYAFYPYGNTEDFDIGNYMEVFLCKDCLKEMWTHKQIADHCLTKEDIKFIKEYKNYIFKIAK